MKLIGGPPEITAAERQLTIARADAADQVRIPYLAGYEHFRYAAEEGVDSHGFPLYRYEWSYRTEIAE
ncbi:DUF5988 family protein [Streptomyces sp. NPDC059788]|uniref:DUF5988 family protein n=1 Tax=Streptomyces sp. NPDC059788 TaxID=3346948 RepID=UPI00365E7AC9